MKEIQLDVKNNEDTKRYSPKILNLLKFVNYISEKTYTPMEFIGLSGSNMVGLAGLKADFDLIIYGLDNSIRVLIFY
jgi:predicted nucleotidyltransferase